MTTEDIRMKVLDAATALLGDHGLRKLTQPQVAKKAGVRQSHVTYYFPKRSDLIGAVARSYSDAVASEVLQLLQSAQPENLPQVFTALTTALLGDRRRTRTLIGLLVASEEDAQLREQMVQGVLALRQVMAHALGIPEGDKTAAVLQATLWGLAVQHLLLEKHQTEADLKGLIAHTSKQLKSSGARLGKPKASGSRRKVA